MFHFLYLHVPPYALLLVTIKLLLKAMHLRVKAQQYFVSSSYMVIQRAKKVVSDSPGLVDFAIRLVNSVPNLPNGQVMCFEEFE